MSWSIEVLGTPAKVIEKVITEADKIAKSHEGTQESNDIHAAKARIIALVGACKMENDGHTDWNGVKVSANGSHSTDGKGSIYSANLSIQVQRYPLAI